MAELGILTTFTGSLLIALVLGYMAQTLKLSPIIGYLLAGVIVGPFTPGIVANGEIANQLADIGVILLLFGVGIKFQLKELFNVWKIAVPGAFIQSTVSAVIAAALLRLCGWEWHSGIILGMGISVASTVVMVRVLTDNRDIHTPIGHIAIGWTVVEDMLTVAILLALPMIFGNASTDNAAAAFGLAGFKIVALAFTVFIFGKWLIPWALGKIAQTRSAELFTLSVLALALGIAVAASSLFGVSMELGAFLAGIAVGRSEFAARAAGEALPMRDAFAVLFFVSVGMMFDFKALIAHPLISVLVLFVVVCVKPAVAIVTVKLLGEPLSLSIPIGASFSQIGEFSFILGRLAHDLGILGDVGWNAIIASALVSIAINPSIYKKLRSLRAVAPAIMPSSIPLQDHNRCVIIGYGPVGRTVHNIIRRKGVSVSVIELNLKTVHELKEKGTIAIYGDALRPGILEEAGIIGAGSLVISADMEDGAEIVKRAKELNPRLKILARSDYLRGAQALKNAGASVVAAGEAEVAIALAKAVDADNEDTRREHEDMKAGLYRSIGA